MGGQVGEQVGKRNQLKLIAGNWKMYKTGTEALQFTQALFDKIYTHLGVAVTLPEIWLCPSFTALSTVRQTVARLEAPFFVAAQTMESQEQGAYTGEVSAPMLLDLDIRRVLLGHSERRQYFNETDDTVQQKVQTAYQNKMQPIICVGESLAQRDANETDTHVVRQVEAALKGFVPGKEDEVVFAYEPIWAIGTGKTCEAQEANRVCDLIAKTLVKLGLPAYRVLYGGSVKPENATELLSQPAIDGLLVGGASLQVDSFYQIVAAGTTSVGNPSEQSPSPAVAK